MSPLAISPLFQSPGVLQRKKLDENSLNYIRLFQFDWLLICAWPYKDLYVLESLWKRLGIDRVIRQQADSRALEFDIERALRSGCPSGLCSGLEALREAGFGLARSPR
jgi:hypothetical protein